MAGSALAASPAHAQPSPEADDDGARFRGGVSLDGGGIIGSKDTLFYNGFLAGVSGHIGVQIMDLLGIYFVPHLQFGSVTFGVQNTAFELTEGWTAAAATAIVDFTFIDQIFVGAGGGVAAHAPLCTNCEALGGGVIHARVGGYPVMDFGEDGIRRQALMLSGDLKVNILSVPNTDQSITMIQPMVKIGYEAY